ncbi:unnamed protein product [Triticum turgidum subsp. durum]|uniref:DUF4220 domain-containing protein n=1 Tax=Triticum turgidum subsp. durum TaxID=4567 RepID=A0A9R1Q714_TRITD|nr:unnamed protein product [Triticum turgidum subsp. durum]
MLADSTATYTLGHLSLTSRSADHQLMAFWAPFLLLHLGGQDNITAYAIEDNRLWLRHLQALAVQVTAASYILYESTVVGTQALLRYAAVLMFVVGVVKYGERVWALKHADISSSGSKYRFYKNTTDTPSGPPTDERDNTEGLLRTAHLLLDVPKDMFQGPLPIVVVPKHLYGDDHAKSISADEMYRVVEMQLSLMHDVVYSKAVVIYTWYGLCIRVISPVFTAVAFVLFHRSGLSAGDHHYSRADVVITYILLGGAVTLEMVSVLRAMFSRWTSLVLNAREERGMWGLLAHAITSIRRFVLPKRRRSKWWWSNSMGQHNLIDLCVRSRVSRTSRFAGWMGFEDRWNTMVYSSSIPVSTTINKLVMNQVLRTKQCYLLDYDSCSNSTDEPDHIINSRGRHALKRFQLYEKLEKFLYNELDESILVWHIATDLYLRWHKDQGQAAADDVRRLAMATEEISNYMVFLLAARPYMLPGSVSRTRYVNMCYCLTCLKYNTDQDLVSLLQSKMQEYLKRENINDSKKLRDISSNRTLLRATKLARELVSPESGPPAKLEMIAEVWTEMLCYAGYKCSGYSHTKQLSNGGELLSVAALVVEYRRRGILQPTDPMYLYGSGTFQFIKLRAESLIESSNLLSLLGDTDYVPSSSGSLEAP